MPDNGDDRYPDHITAYLNRLYDESGRAHACRAETPEEVRQWQDKARPVLRRLIGLDRIREQSGDCVPTVTLGEVEDLSDHTRRKCIIETEPDVRVPFWLLAPVRHDRPCPLAVTPHGHDPMGPDTYAGVAHDEAHAERIAAEDRDVAVQAARAGFVTVAPATRGLAQGGVTDLFGRHGNRDCQSHFMHALLAGRTLIGERVWDMERIIDWVLTLDDVDDNDILMMGNSGGGVLTTYAAACDTRITIAVASCSFSSFVGLNGKIQHCPCNAVPGMLGFGECWDVAGLIAPRRFLAIHGRLDKVKATDEVDRAVAGLKTIYRAAGMPGNFLQRYGDAGHRFYSKLMWPFILEATRK